MKKVIIGSILVVGLTAGLAFAHGNGYGFRGNGSHMGGNGYHMGGGGNGMMGPGMKGRRMMGNYGGSGGKGGWGNNYCTGASWSGQNNWNSEGHQKFLAETVELRKQMNEKRFELKEIARSSNVDRDKLAQLEKEMIDIRTQIQKKADELSGVVK